MDVGVHLPIADLDGAGLSWRRVRAVVDAARDLGLAAVAANDHLTFSAPWLDGPATLAAVVERSGSMELMTSVALPVVRGVPQLAATLTALQVLSEGRLVAGVGPGSSREDYALASVPFEERWPRFERAVRELRVATDVPLWVGSWGSAAGLRRVARHGQGWLASAYNTTPELLARGRADLHRELASARRRGTHLPVALATTWTWVTDDPTEAERVLRDVVAPRLRRDPESLRNRTCIGTPQQCASFLAAYAAAGCDRVLLWPVGDEPRQLERVVSEVLPLL